MTSPQFDWWKFAGNTMQDIGYGLGTSPTLAGGFAAGARRQQEQQPYRDAYATQQKAEAERAKLIAETAARRNSYADGFAKQGAAPLLVDMVRNGDADPVSVYWDLNKPTQPSDPSETIGGRAQLAQTWGLEGDEAKSYVLTGKLPEAAKPASMPTSWQEYQLAQTDPNYAKTLASSSSKPPTDQDVRMQKLTEVVQPDIDLLNRPTEDGRTVYDALGDLGNQAANGVDFFGAKPLYGATSPEFQQAQAALANIAQSYLYAISGQAAPAGEVAKIVDSVTPKPFESPAAIEEKKRRLKTYVDAIKLSKYDAAGLIKGQGAGQTNYKDKYGLE